jgi:hypothetical protein
MWKLWTRDENVQPPAVGSGEFDSDKRALEKACDLITRSVHVKVLYIEKPNGDRFELAAIKACRDAHNLRRHEDRRGPHRRNL